MDVNSSGSLRALRVGSSAGRAASSVFYRRLSLTAAPRPQAAVSEDGVKGEAFAGPADGPDEVGDGTACPASCHCPEATGTQNSSVFTVNAAYQGLCVKIQVALHRAHVGNTHKPRAGFGKLQALQGKSQPFAGDGAGYFKQLLGPRAE